MERVRSGAPVLQNLNQGSFSERRPRGIRKSLNDAEPCQAGSQMRVALVDADAMLDFDLGPFSIVFEAKGYCPAGLRGDITDQPVSVLQLLRVGRNAMRSRSESFAPQTRDRRGVHSLSEWQ